MTWIIPTENSVYELDSMNRRVRRLSGTGAPTECFSPEGEWKYYERMAIHDESLLFIWLSGAPHAFTLTSRIRIGGCRPGDDLTSPDGYGMMTEQREATAADPGGEPMRL